METRSRPTSSAGATKANQRRRDVEHGGLLWIDIAQPTAADLAALRERFSFDPLILDSLLGDARRPRLELASAQEYLFLELHVPTVDRENTLVSSSVGVIASRSTIITIHDGNLKSLRRLFAAAATDEPARAQLLGRGPGYLLYRVVDALIKQSFPLVYRLDETLAQIDARLFQRGQRGLARELLNARRELVATRAILRPNMAPLEALRSTAAPFLQLDVARYFGDVQQSGLRLWELVEEQTELTQALGTALDTLTAQRNGTTLTLLATLLIILIPLVLLAALAALNTAIPLVERPLAFLSIVLLVVVAAVGTLALLRYRSVV